VNVFTHNFNYKSNSGPNKFTRQLFLNLANNFNVKITDKQEEADVEFCLIQQQVYKAKPMLLRLDGIYFNSEQDYNTQNGPIKYSYDNADAVIYQSEFNKALIEKWFGQHKNGHIVHNAADLNLIKKVPILIDSRLDSFSEVWVSASTWRPHKRLRANMLYFLEHAPKNACMVIAGKIDNFDIFSDFNDHRLMYTGELSWPALISLCKKATTFVHLAYLDHCPNVVVDAQACGCKIICSSTGGTSEIVKNGIIIAEDPWDYKPIALYKPPDLDFEKITEVMLTCNNSIVEVSKKYFNIMSSIS